MAFSKAFLSLSHSPLLFMGHHRKNVVEFEQGNVTFSAPKVTKIHFVKVEGNVILFYVNVLMKLKVQFLG